jgi:hypothetical protein
MKNNNRYAMRAIGLLLLSLMFWSNDCNGPEPEDFIDYLSKEGWEVDHVINTCTDDTVTSDYTNFTISFTEDKGNSDSNTVVVDYSTSYGSPAFPASGELMISVADLADNAITATRDDSIVVRFRNLYSNIRDGDILDFSVKEIAECDTTETMAKMRFEKYLRMGDISFRCRRR